MGVRDLLFSLRCGSFSCRGAALLRPPLFARVAAQFIASPSAPLSPKFPPSLRAEQADVFPPRSFLERVGLRREESLFCLLPSAFCLLPSAFCPMPQVWLE